MCVETFTYVCRKNKLYLHEDYRPQGFGETVMRQSKIFGF